MGQCQVTKEEEVKEQEEYVTMSCLGCTLFLILALEIDQRIFNYIGNCFT